MRDEIGRDAPWIEEAEYYGFHTPEDPYENATESEFLQGADEEYGWKILAWRLSIEEDAVPQDDEWQAVWVQLPRNIRNMYCKAFRRLYRNDAQNYYDKWYGGN